MSYRSIHAGQPVMHIGVRQALFVAGVGLAAALITGGASIAAGVGPVLDHAVATLQTAMNP